MGFFSRLKRKPRTYSSNFSNYRPLRSGKRKPFEPKQSRSERPVRNSFAFKAVRILKILLGLAVLAFFIYLIFFTKSFEIQKIEVTGTEATVTEQSLLNKTLQEHLGKNLLFFNASLLEDTLFKDYPYLKELKVGRKLFHTLSVNLETYENRANVTVQFENGTEQSYVVNELGFVSGTGTSLDSLPTLVMDVTGTKLDLSQNTEESAEESTEEKKDSFLLNEELIDADVLKILVESSEDFAGKFNMQIIETHYLKQAREMHLVTERYFTVWIDLTGDVNDQMAKLKKALSTLNIYEADLEYIDLRISGQNGEKVIYKMKDS